MKVADLMSTDVHMVTPNQTLREVAMLMFDEDIGAVPVTDRDRLVGMVTDRDIAIRAVAQGRGPDTTVRDIMTEQVKYCFEDDDLDQVSKNMATIQMRRLPVMSRDKRLVGMIALADLATSERARAEALQALHGISLAGD